MKEVVTVGIMGTSGVMTVGDLLLKASEKMGYFAFAQRHNTSQIKDGPVAVKITIDGSRARECCDDKVDILLSFSWQKLFARDFPLKQETLILSDEAFHFDSLAREKTGSIQAGNIIGLGLVAGYLDWPQELISQVMMENFKQNTKAAERNLQCLRLGFELVEKSAIDFMLAKPNLGTFENMVMTGNKAIAMGALAAKCLFLGFYPITPATDIAEEMISEILARGGLFVQAEDEIAALGFCLGASEAGVKSLDVTSGPGFDLKTETIGLAVIDEVPVVIVDVQRAGPATGLATMTEQSDLWQAIKGGHGDAPRVVLAPHNIEECYRLIIEAFNISEEFQVPVILLSDQWLGQAKAILPRILLDKDYPVKERLRPPYACGPGEYNRYTLTPGFISPMQNAGDEGAVYQTVGSTHDEKGRPSANFLNHQAMHEKRQKKLEPLRQRKDLVKVSGPENAKIGIVIWGSSGRLLQEVIRNMGLEEDVKICIPELISPLPTKILQDFLNGLEKVLFVEMNHSGQLYHYLRAELDLPQSKSFYFRAGGLPFLKQEIIDWIGGVLNG